MARKPSTDRKGQDFPKEVQDRVWERGKPITGYSPNSHRFDKCEAMMRFMDYGNRNSDYGWEIDHIKPVISGGSDDLINLQPLNWKNNADKGDQLYWRCPG